MILLRDYQEKYVKRLAEEIKDLSYSSENEICVFQSPTGSGKTVMIAETLKRLIENVKDKKLSFVWISVRKLHEQSKEKLEKYYEDTQVLTCSNFQDLRDKKINENEILFINWESINKADKNTIIKENEQDFYLESIIANTKEEGNEIILILDESHHTAGSEKSQELINIINPKITIEVSATPHLKDKGSSFIRVKLDEVKIDEMIKSEIDVNPDFMNADIGSKDSDELIIKKSLEKRKELVSLYKKVGSNVNPLLLIQLPDKSGGQELKKEKILKILEKENITEKNGKLAIWLSEQKSETLVNVEKNNNEVEVLIFKQAIALGWDCPRASILDIFRESKSFQFTIQTIGRIMRMPELKYYSQEPELDKGFIFTNISDVEARITEDYAKDYITVYESKRRNEIYNNIKLISVYLKRQRERTRLSGEFKDIFIKIAEELSIEKKVDLNPSKIINPIISDAVIENIDKIGKIDYKEEIKVKLSDEEINEKFNLFVNLMCSPFAPHDSSHIMKTALYQFFNKKYKLEKYDSRIQKIILAPENIQLFVKAIVLSKQKYKEDIIDKIAENREVEINKEWEIPLSIRYTSKYKSEEKRTSIMKPLYILKSSEPERKFMEALDKSKKVKWWFRNGEGEVKYFAVLYKDKNGFNRAFYVDFIVLFNDGFIGLFDTKSGFTAEDEKAKFKAESLQKYIKGENKSNKKIFGGLLIDLEGVWMYNDNLEYEYNKKTLTKEGWKNLDL
ncbi:Type III restriction enzyme, res subunit [uncultured archaeon]|nr:Type III restriction enzyme, res subunit [uncultured archaeon]